MGRVARLPPFTEVPARLVFSETRLFTPEGSASPFRRSRAPGGASPLTTRVRRQTYRPGSGTGRSPRRRRNPRVPPRAAPSRTRKGQGSAYASALGHCQNHASPSEQPPPESLTPLGLQLLPQSVGFLSLSF